MTNLTEDECLELIVDLFKNERTKKMIQYQYNLPENDPTLIDKILQVTVLKESWYDDSFDEDGDLWDDDFRIFRLKEDTLLIGEEAEFSVELEFNEDNNLIGLDISCN
jgi:hypothetical protein